MRDLDDVERENALHDHGYMDAAAVPVPDAGDTMDGEFNLTAVKVLIDHQRRDAGSCICDWGVDTGNLGQSHALHVWRELQAVGVTLPVPDTGDDTLREQLAQALTPLCDLPRVQHTYGNRGPCLHDRARIDALLPLIRAHVAAAVQAERERIARKLIEVSNEQTPKGPRQAALWDAGHYFLDGTEATP